MICKISTWKFYHGTRKFTRLNSLKTRQFLDFNSKKTNFHQRERFQILTFFLFSIVKSSFLTEDGFPGWKEEEQFKNNSTSFTNYNKDDISCENKVLFILTKKDFLAFDLHNCPGNGTILKLLQEIMEWNHELTCITPVHFIFILFIIWLWVIGHVTHGIIVPGVAYILDRITISIIKMKAIWNSNFRGGYSNWQILFVYLCPSIFDWI